MIKINLVSTKEEFEIGNKVFEADFSDNNLKDYFQYGQDMYKKEQEIAKEFPNIENEKDFDKVAHAIVKVLPKKAEGLKGFFDKTFGAGQGEVVYKICGESTSNMQKVFEVIWVVILEKMQNVESEGQKTVDKYVKNSNKNKNK